MLAIFSTKIGSTFWMIRWWLCKLKHGVDEKHAFYYYLTSVNFLFKKLKAYLLASIQSASFYF